MNLMRWFLNTLYCLYGGIMLISAKNKLAALMGSSLLVMMFFLQGCPIIAVAIYAASTDDGITVTVEIPRSAPEVFEAAKKRAARGVSETGVPFNVVQIDEDDYSIIVEGADGSWRGSFAVIPIGASKSQLLAQGTDDVREKDESESLILLGVEALCRDLDVEYNVIKN